MRRALISALLIAFAVQGCGSRQETAQDSTVDSLLATNPTEQTSGDITPQTEYQQPTEEPASTPARPTVTRSKPRTSTPARRATSTPSTPSQPRGVTVPAGTGVKVQVATRISTETAQEGDTWTGTVQEPVIIGDRVAIPAGSTVTGVVTTAIPAKKGDRATLGLAVRSVEVEGKTHALSASTESIVAGSTRARNLGAIAGGAAAGALLGKAIGGSSKGAVVGGILGGAAAGGAVAASKGYQVTLKEGTELTFNVNDAVVMR
jgi:hypothetical protein